MIPRNLLKMALSIQPKHIVRFFRCTGRTQNAAGDDINQFAPGVDISSGQVQSVPLSKFEALGLDMAKTYVSWFVPDTHVVAADERGNNGDEINWDGRRWKIVNGNADWLAQNGWVNVIACATGVAHD